MPDNRTKERVTMSIDKELMKRLRKQCEKDRRTYSAAVEIGIEYYLKRSAKEKK